MNCQTTMEKVLNIGEFLKELRQNLGLNLNDVSERTSINTTSLSRIETGKRLPTLEQVRELADLFKKDESELVKHLLSDKILYELKDDELSLEALKLAEQKLIYERNLFNDYESLEKFDLQSRRYIGNKSKLAEWIMEIVEEETEGRRTFIDVFSGTSAVARAAMEKFDAVVLNDILYSNTIIYKAFYSSLKWDKNKVVDIVNYYNLLDPNTLPENYFSKNFGNKFYEKGVSKTIGFIREDIENRKVNNTINSREHAILLASLIYTIDRLANTVGHFDAYIKKDIPIKPLNFRLINTEDFDGARIFQEDANELASNIQGDVAYIDPPYNSRQYSRFYHIYENLVQWKKPKLFGVALKPEPENMSKYCTVKAKDAFKDLVNKLDVNYLVVSYNNTYKSKSKSSENKIKYEEIIDILDEVGPTQVFEQSHKFFNTGKTDFDDHKEFIFLTHKR